MVLFIASLVAKAHCVAKSIEFCSITCVLVIGCHHGAGRVIFCDEKDAVRLLDLLLGRVLLHVRTGGG